MARTKMVRNVSTKFPNTYYMDGFLLTEKMKRSLRARGLNVEKDETWADNFNADVVYRYNEKKRKLDVYVGSVKAVRYKSGNLASTVPNNEITYDLDYVNTLVAPNVRRAQIRSYEISGDTVKVK